MTDDIIEKIEIDAKQSIREYYMCEEGIPCSVRANCRFCNGHIISNACKKSCTADIYYKGFIEGARAAIKELNGIEI